MSSVCCSLITVCCFSSHSLFIVVDVDVVIVINVFFEVMSYILVTGVYSYFYCSLFDFEDYLYYYDFCHEY